ncbi:hypothetical protein DITRI_Ditri06bG0020000 [Diplodiscus trichospermus]
MVMGLRIIFFVAFTILATSVAGIAAQAKPGCQSHCGNLSIPYPFGTGHGCNISQEFLITCNTTFHPPKAFLTASTIEVVDISLDGHLRINNSVGYDCYNLSGRSSYFNPWIRLSKFPISSSNKFLAIGCDTYARVQGSVGQKYSTGCLTLCTNITDLINGSCSGIGCCETAIPKGVRSHSINLDSYNKHLGILSFNPCSYGFVAEDGAYNFSIANLHDDNFRSKKFLMILDWTIGNQTCTEAQIDAENYACKENSHCIDPENGPGYLCKCLDGFEGNPYLSHGCQDIDECLTLKPCNGTCHTLAGSYNCSCPEGFEGDGRKNGTGCSPIIPHRQSFPTLVVALGIGISVLASLLCLSWVYLGLRQRKLAKLKQKNFKQNGGILLREEISKRKDCGRIATIFTAEELKKATNNYVESRILGKGAQVLSWETRLKIATEAAEALSYLHSAASPPIIHRDVKLTNILLDENYSTRVSDFGSSRLIPSDEAQIATLVQGTLGYLDPEYFHTNQLTEKSDVYSFDVVLIELLTGLKVLSFQRPEEERNLSMYFVSMMKEDRLLEILDRRVINEKTIKQLKEVATLARRCVRVKGEERPTMKEVASELEGLRAMEKRPWGKADMYEEEAESLLHYDPYNINSPGLHLNRVRQH